MCPPTAPTLSLNKGVRHVLLTACDLMLHQFAALRKGYGGRFWPVADATAGDRGGGFLGYCGRRDYHWLRLAFHQSESGTADA